MATDSIIKGLILNNVYALANRNMNEHMTSLKTVEYHPMSDRILYSLNKLGMVTATMLVSRPTDAERVIRTATIATAFLFVGYCVSSLASAVDMSTSTSSGSVVVA